MESVSQTKNQRSCIVCGNKALKKDLLRVVRSPEGVIGFDDTGKAAGRGAYVCSLDCLEKAVATKRFERSLKMSLTHVDVDRVKTEVERAIGTL